MSDRSYSWVTNVALVLGVVSAFIYDRVPHPFALGLGCVAAIISIGAYFYNQFSRLGLAETTSDACEVLPASRSDVFVLPLDRQPQTVETTLDEIRLFAFERAVREKMTMLSAALAQERISQNQRKAAWMQQYLQRSNAGRRLRYGFPSDNSLVTPEVELSESEAASCYAQIIRDMTAGEKNSWDFVIDRNGLRVSEKRHPMEVVEVDTEDYLWSPPEEDRPELHTES